MTAMICPKCDTPMREIRRSGVLIERCVSCGGVFLDRGELEHLVEGERSYYDQPPRHAERDVVRDDEYVDDDYDDDPGRRSGKRRQSRKRSFFEELLDFDLD